VEGQKQWWKGWRGNENGRKEKVKILMSESIEK